MRIRITAMAVAMTALIIVSAAPAFAQTGPHYSLNIIGVENSKNSSLTDSQRKTIFVALGSKTSAVTSKIYLTPGDHFEVCDGNAFAPFPATDCNGNTIGSGAGAVFMLPCNTNLSSTNGEVVQPCDAPETTNGFVLAYEVWARALGQPGGNATMKTCATEVVDVNGNATTEEICSTENVLLFRSNKKNPDPNTGNTSGKQVFKDVTQELTSLVACVDTTCTRYALFRNELEDWFWQYANKGLRLAQLRFITLEE